MGSAKFCGFSQMAPPRSKLSRRGLEFAVVLAPNSLVPDDFMPIRKRISSLYE